MLHRRETTRSSAAWRCKNIMDRVRFLQSFAGVVKREIKNNHLSGRFFLFFYLFFPSRQCEVKVLADFFFFFFFLYNYDYVYRIELIVQVYGTVSRKRRYAEETNKRLQKKNLLQNWTPNCASKDAEFFIPYN